MKTIREHLNSLPEPYRTEAIMETINQNGESILSKEYESFYHAISEAFVWADSRKGFYYWYNTANKYSIITGYLEDLIRSTEPQCRQSEPPIPTNRSDSIGKDAAINKSVWVDHLFKNWNDTSFSLNILHFGPPRSEERRVGKECRL